ncbi:hypothetical protein AHiyo4_11980 [Arthrobacter sp. Hiyo4]|nr:hypothetical protein AHiyo4_11980 [Arthrobacter sp. Hiyo4]
MIPAHQCLHGSHGPLGQVNDGLEEDAQLAVANPLPQFPFGAQTVVTAGAQVLVVDRVTAPARVLGPVHGDVRVLQQFGGVLVPPGQGNADAGGGPQDVSVDLVGSLEGGQQAAAHVFGRGTVGNVLTEHNEFVSCQARHGVTLAPQLGKPEADLDQEEIPCSVSPGVVDGFEAIHIHEEHGQACAAPMGPRQGLADPVHQQHPVG